MKKIFLLTIFLTAGLFFYPNHVLAEHKGCCVMKDTGGKVMRCNDDLADKSYCEEGWSSPNKWEDGLYCKDLADCSAVIAAGTTGCCQSLSNASVQGCFNTLKQNCVSECYNWTNGTCDSIDTCSGKIISGDKLTSINTCGTVPETTQLQDDLKSGRIISTPGKLQVSIPGLDFTKINSVDEQGYLYIPWIAEYMTALYKFLIGVVTIFAVVMIVIQGTRVVTSGGGQQKTDAYKKIFKAIIGLAIAWGSYAILYNINPDLVTFNALKVKYIDPIALEGEGEKDMSPEQAEAADASYSSGSGRTISSLIGSYKGGGCSDATGAKAAATALIQPPYVCVGPCHCAWTAANFLKYIGCADIYRPEGGFPLGLLHNAIGKEWIAQVIDGGQRSNLPVGLLITGGGGHAAVSIGNGRIFESGGGQNIGNLPRLQWTEAVAKPEVYKACARVTGEEPFKSPKPNFGGPLDKTTGKINGCDKTQLWTVSNIRSGFVIIVAPRENFTKVGYQLTYKPISATIFYGSGGKYVHSVMIDSDVCDIGINNKTSKGKPDPWCRK